MDLTWLSEFMRFLGKFFPRVLIVPATHEGVKFKRGRHVRPLRPGVHVYWPLLTEVKTLPVVRQTVNLPSQALTTADGKCVVAGGMVRYKIRNVVEALARTWDIDQAVIDETLTVLCDYITNQTFMQLQTDRAAVNEALTARVHAQLTSYGVTVLLAQLTDFSICRTINLLGIQPSAPTQVTLAE